MPKQPKPVLGNTTGKPLSEEIQRQSDSPTLRPVSRHRMTDNGDERTEFSLGGQVVTVTFTEEAVAVEVPINLSYVPTCMDMVGPARFGDGATPMPVMPYEVQMEDWTKRKVYLACTRVASEGDSTPFPVAFRFRIY